EAIVSETLAGRRGEAARAEAIVASEAAKFHEWHASLDVVPAIASLRARAEEIREAELRKAEGLLERLDDSQRRAVESITAQIVKKLMHLTTVRMKQDAAAAVGVIYADDVRSRTCSARAPTLHRRELGESHYHGGSLRVVGRLVPRARRAARRAVRRDGDPPRHARRDCVGAAQGAALGARADALDRAVAR